MNNDTYIVLFQDENNTPQFCTDYLNSDDWSSNIFHAQQFDTFLSAQDARMYIESTDSCPTAGLCVLTYQSVFEYSYKWLDDLLLAATNV